MSEEETVEQTEVYVVTHGCYSDYGIESVWLTLAEAEACIGEGGDSDGYGRRVEVWPVGDNDRTLGTFSVLMDFNRKTGAEVQPFVVTNSEDWPVRHRADIIGWVNHHPMGAELVGIRISTDSRERAEKVYSEMRAQVLAAIDQQLPLEAFCTQVWVNGGWHRVQPGSSLPHSSP